MEMICMTISKSLRDLIIQQLKQLLSKKRRKKMIGKKIDILSHQSLYQSFKKARRSYFLPKVFYYCNISFLYRKCNVDILTYMTYLNNRNLIISFLRKRLSKCLKVLRDHRMQLNKLIFKDLSKNLKIVIFNNSMIEFITSLWNKYDHL